MSVVGRPAGELALLLHGLTDSRGDFTYSSEAARHSCGGGFTLEVDVDAYYASQGIMAGYKQVTFAVRVVGSQTDYRVGMFITPFAHTAWSVR